MAEPIAITGVGIVCALGHSRHEVTQNLRAGTRAFAPVRRFDATSYRVNLAAEAPTLDIAGRFGPATSRNYSRTDHLALWAADDALQQANLPHPALQGTAIYVGACTGGMAEMESTLALHRRASLATYRNYPVWATALAIGNLLGIGGPRATYMTACSSAAHAIGVAMRRLRTGEHHVALAGGTESLARLTLAGFGALGVLDPDGTRPFDANRKGITLGEGAAFFVLEPAAAARQRGAEILALIAGYGASADADHMIHPRADGAGALRAIRSALDDAGVAADEIDYVNAHGTGTVQNDSAEAHVLQRVFGDRALRVSSSKSMFGHTLGAAAALEAAATVLAIVDNFTPPNAGVQNVAPELARLVLVRAAEPVRPQATLSTSFAFGGNNAALVILCADAAARGLGRSRPAVRVPVMVSGAAVSCSGGTATEASALWALLDRQPNGSALVGLDAAAILGRAAIRRMDTLGAATASICALAQRSAGIPSHTELALGFGTSFGSLDTTIAFLTRLFDKGPTLCNPIDFPNLVHNAGAGHASILLGAMGPNVTATHAEHSGDEAIRLMVEHIQSGELAAAIAGGADLAPPALAQAYTMIDSAVGTRSQHAAVAGAIAIEAADACQRRGALPWARIVGIGAAGPAAGIVAAIERAVALAAAVTDVSAGADLWLQGATESFGEGHERAAAQLEFLKRARLVQARQRLGDAGGAGAAVIALGAAAIHLGKARCVLVTAVTRDGGAHATLLGPPS